MKRSITNAIIEKIGVDYSTLSIPIVRSDIRLV